jgi:hypothetical protein
MRVSILKLLHDFSLPKPKTFIAARGVLSLFLGIPLSVLHVRGLYQDNTTTTGNWLVVQYV